MDFDFVSNDKKQTKVQFKANDWKHVSQLQVDRDRRQVQFQSDTESGGRPQFNVDSLYNGGNGKSYVKVNVPAYQSQLNVDLLKEKREKKANVEIVVKDVKHRTQYSNGPKVIVIESKSRQNGRNWHDLDYNYDKNSRVHQLNTQFDNNYRMEAEGKPWSDDYDSVQP